MKENFNALDFANWFLWYNLVQKNVQIQNIDEDYDVYEGLTHLKIQKLLYFADGISLAVRNKPLFTEKIYAWPHGPVVKEVYTELCVNKNKEIPFDNSNYSTIQKINQNTELYNILVTTYENYAGYTAWQLREKSHVAGGPWQITVDKEGINKEIKPELIKDFFKKSIVRFDE